MWFRRKKKLLPVALPEEPFRPGDVDAPNPDVVAIQNRTESQLRPGRPSPAASDPEKSDTDGASGDRAAEVSMPTGSASATSHSVASKEHLNWNFDVDCSLEDTSGIQESRETHDKSNDEVGRAPGDAINSAGTTRSSSLSLVGVGAQSEQHDPDLISATVETQAVLSPAAEDIPVLNNVAYIPEKPPQQKEGQDSAGKPIVVDLCIEDIKTRLLQHDKLVLSTEQEKILRTVLSEQLMQPVPGDHSPD